MTTETTLTRVQVRKILQRHKGSISAIAKDLGISHSTVSQWLHGKTTSSPVAKAAAAKAAELLATEGQAA